MIVQALARSLALSSARARARDARERPGMGRGEPSGRHLHPRDDNDRSNQAVETKARC